MTAEYQKALGGFLNDIAASGHVPADRDKTPDTGLKGVSEPELTEFQQSIVDEGQCPICGGLLKQTTENVGFDEPGAEKIETAVSCEDCRREY